MAKKVLTLIKLQIPAGAANPAPPVGPALGQHGVNIMDFCKAFNAQTQQDSGTIIPVEITVFEDRSFTFITKTPPAAVLIKEAIGIQKGSGEPHVNKVGNDQRRPDPRDRREEDARPERKRPRRRLEDHRRHRPLDGRRRGGKLMASKHGKRFRAAYEKIDRTHHYEPAEAVALLKQTATARFDETVEVHIRLGVNVRHADEQLRGTLALPNGAGRDVTVAVFAEGDKAREATEAGAEFVGSDDLAERIEAGWTDFDIVIATPDQMPKVGRLGRILGPQGKMPNPKVGTVTDDVTKAVTETKSGKIEYRTDRQAVVHLSIGKVSFTEQALLENYAAVIDEIVRAKPAAAKGRYIISITLTTTMGPGIRVDSSRTRDRRSSAPTTPSPRRKPRSPRPPPAVGRHRRRLRPTLLYRKG